eukprot:jgi/Ulvmu1/7155/UM034_0062.1
MLCMYTRGGRAGTTQRALLLLVVLQSAWTVVIALQNTHLLPLSPRRRLQELSEASHAFPVPKAIARPPSRRLAAQAAHSPTRSLLDGENREHASVQTNSSAPPSATPALQDTDDQLIVEPDVGVEPQNVTVSHGGNATTRPFKSAFFDEPGSWATPELREYVMERLVPAASAVLARSIRVRDPTGPLPLLGFPDEEGNPIPDIYGDGDDIGGINADIVFKVTTGRGPSLFGTTCLTAAAYAFPVYVDDLTQRPIYGVITLCKFDPSRFHQDLETMLHEMLHPLGFADSLFGQFRGYEEAYLDVLLQGDNVTVIQSPQVRAEARRHFNCSRLLGAAVEDDLSRGSAGNHWESRLFRGELMTPVIVGNPDGSGQRQVLTDFTLALLQDTNWYDVKYGSAGFNSYGYHAGCEFAMGTFEEAIEAPAAQPFLCPAMNLGRSACLPDHTAEAACDLQPNWNGFVAPDFNRFADDECHNAAGLPGDRCLRTGSTLGCVRMSCSPAGRVLVDGVPCDPEESLCPDDELMCGDPGLLTCAETLNDCSGRGTCLHGKCYCHLAWGGDDCSLPICVSQCDDGSPCPPSGFCGVPECGEWSVGSKSRGVPCNAPPDFSEPPLDTYVSTAPPEGAPAEEDPDADAPSVTDIESDYSADDDDLGISIEFDYADGSEDEEPGGQTAIPPIGTPGIVYDGSVTTEPSMTSGDSDGDNTAAENGSDSSSTLPAPLEGSGAQPAAAHVLRAVFAVVVATGVFV